MAKYANPQVAHVWANQDRNGITSGESHNGNFWFEGARLYSYRTVIAIKTGDQAPDGRRVVLLTSHGYSQTTLGKHIAPTWRALDYGRPGSGWRVFKVPHLEASAREVDSVADLHKKNLAHLLESAIAEHASAKRARNYTDSHLARAAEHLADAREYAATFKVKWKEPGDLDALASEMQAAKDREARRLAKEKKARDAEARAAQLESFKAWQAGEPGSYCPGAFRTAPDGTVYLRRSPDGEDLQTSLGASVPWTHALKAFRFIKLCRERGAIFQRNGRTIRVGHFTVDSIDAKGNMRAGCHSFSWPEIERLAKAESVFDVPPSDEAVESSH